MQEVLSVHPEDFAVTGLLHVIISVAAAQDARYSMGYFVWPADGVLIQGPAKKYPPTTMKEFMKVSPLHSVAPSLPSMLLIPVKSYIRVPLTV